MRAQGAFHEDNTEFKFDDAAEARREAQRERFRRTVDGLERAWPIEYRHNPFHPLVTWTKAGPKLGAATLLARKGAREDAQLIALLSIGCGVPVSAAALPFLRRAEIEFDRGRYAQSAKQIALARVPPLRGEEAARRLFFAAGILDAGFASPARLMAMCGLDGCELEAMDEEMHFL